MTKTDPAPLRIVNSPSAPVVYLVTASLGVVGLAVMSWLSRRDGSIVVGDETYGPGWTAGVIGFCVLWLVLFVYLAFSVPRWLELGERLRYRLLLGESVHDWANVKGVAFRSEKAGRWLVITLVGDTQLMLPVTEAEEERIRRWLPERGLGRLLPRDATETGNGSQKTSEKP